MSKNLSAKYYQENKEKVQKKARERYQSPELILNKLKFKLMLIFFCFAKFFAIF